MQDKVSVITPTWNSEKYILRAIKSVQSQSYDNWEMIIVDDCSFDKTCKIIEKCSNVDNRIRLIKQPINQGAAIARNKAMELATGRYFAFLDSDDIWKPKKLEKQIEFMTNNHCGFSCSSYEVINDKGVKLNKIIKMMPKCDYYCFLTNNLLQTVGIIVDTKIIDKKLLVMPDIRRRQDAATWLQILKAGYTCYGMDDVLAEYRRTNNSLSSNKIKAIKGMWHLYTKIEKLPIHISIYCFIRYAMLAIWKRIYIW